MEGILYDISTLYTGLVNAIVTQLNIEENINSVEIKYIVSEMCWGKGFSRSDEGEFGFFLQNIHYASL